MIEFIKNRVEVGRYRFTIHALERCVQRNISPQEIKKAILSGEIIENYPDDKYGPSCLIYGTTREGRILHIHCSIDPVWIITAYDPALCAEEWEENFKRRK